MKLPYTYILTFVTFILCFVTSNSQENGNNRTEVTTCALGEFRCNTGKCIPQRWECDFMPDCEDGSDEPPECVPIVCVHGQFQCKTTHKCIPTGWMCDGEPDCGASDKAVSDNSDEEPDRCGKSSCLWNSARCGNSTDCIPIAHFCDGNPDCPNKVDEGDHCKNKSGCESLNCSYGCKQTASESLCFCPPGKRPNKTECVDSDECQLDGSCDQICTNTIGSFTCSCAPGYKQFGATKCKAINVPENEEPSLIFSSTMFIRRVHLDGSPWPGNSIISNRQTFSLEFDHRNRTLCYIHSKDSVVLTCADIDDLNKTWDLPSPTMFPLLSNTHIALDWVSGNWYFLDDTREMIYVCTSTIKFCRILIDVNLNKPRDLALDPTKGYMFFTKWGVTSPMLERASLDGTDRKTLVDHKIVYPFGVTVDYTTQHVYWVDTYLDFVERVDYDGLNRRTVRKGFPVQNLYDVTLFENNLFVTSWRSQSIIRLSKFDSGDHDTIPNFSRPFAINVFHRQRQPDVSHPCRINNGGCEQFCIPTWKKNNPIAHCMCQPGYRVVGGRKCIPAKQTKFLLYGKGRPAMIKGISMSVMRRDEEEMVPINDLARPASLDYDVRTQYIYFSDVQKFVIARQKIDGTKRETVINKSLNNCEGLAVDWMGRNLYWTDEGLSIISVASLDNVEHRRTIIQDNMFHPRAIVLDPKMGWMYWSVWGSGSQGKIERAWMNGDKREVFYDSDLHWPSGLTIDYSTRRLYWCDAYLDKIERISLETKFKEVVFQGALLDHPYGLALYDDFLFWTEFQKGTVQRYNLDNKTLETLTIENPPLFEIRVFDNETQGGSNQCFHSLKCNELCLATPDGAVCACRDSYYIAPNLTCVPEPNYKPPSRCPHMHFQCAKNLRCIEDKYVCDGDDDCGDGSDENTESGGICEKVKCRDDQFQCDTNRCISSLWLCDEESDCSDGSDEHLEYCAHVTCPTNQFTCQVSHRCIPMSWVCDMDNDCGEGDNSDESNNCSYPECLPTEFLCANHACIPQEFVCDSDNDCKDGSDEKSCADICLESQFYCATDSECISMAKKCDGVRDCEDGADEASCPAGIITDHSSSKESKEKYPQQSLCEAHEFQCKDVTQKCIRKKFICDGRNDCIDGSDEIGCDSGPKNCTSESCEKRPEQPIHVLPNCSYPNRLCDINTKCISIDRVCDTKMDCDDWSDEGLRCYEELCKHSLECSHNCHNTPEGFICSCPEQLHLQTDGVTCLASHPCDGWGTCSQTCMAFGKLGHKCGCNEGYHLQADGFSCKSTDPSTPYVIFSNRHELRGVDLHSFNLKALISSLKNTIALDFYHTNDSDIIFWTDVVDDKIYKGSLIGGTLANIEVVVRTGLSTAEGLAVDWIGENLYWVESNLDQIEVAKLNGSYRRTLIAGDMESPRAIALDPRFGLLFWTDWDPNTPRIERCSMSGEHREVVVYVDEVTDGAWPNGLTLDYQLKRIYWIDARSDSIHTVTYDGHDHREIMRGHVTLSHPFAIAVYENHVYWTDWRTNSVLRASKWNGSDITVMQRTLSQPFDVKILHPSRQPRNAYNPCEVNNGNCSHLCLLNINSTRKCHCPHVMKLQDDGLTCVVNERVLLFSRANEIRGVDLAQPYYHTIPTISVPQVLSPTQLDFIASNKSIFWTDGQVNEVKRAGLTGGTTQSIIDTGINHPSGFALDWISGNMYITSSSNTQNKILVCTLEGEYITTIYETEAGSENSEDASWEIKSLAVDPRGSLMYWSMVNKVGLSTIESARMDGSNHRKLVNLKRDQFLAGAISLFVDYEGKRLYWVNGESHNIQYLIIDDLAVHNVPLPENSSPTAVIVYHNLIYYADQEAAAIHSCDKTTGENNSVVRNNTGNVLSIKIYDATSQTGENACSKNKGNCSHLCLPISKTERVCCCATGYSVDPLDPLKCIGADEFLLYSINWEVKGYPIEGTDNKTEVLGPISRVSMATSIDFHGDFIYWADSDHGTITRIRRDGTGRQAVVEHFEGIENIPTDWLAGLAVDWIGENLYWSDPKLNVIEVSRLNGSSRYVVIPNGIQSPHSIALDPFRGYMFWSETGKEPRISRAGLDGSNRMILLNFTTGKVSDIALDYLSNMVYWTDIDLNTIERMNYDGSGREVLLNHSLDNPFSLTHYNGKVYWMDITHEKGSIKVAPDTNLSDFTIILKNAGDSLKDITVFSQQRELGTNPCAKNNGGCQELCLFNGKQPVCACAHGLVDKDGKSCKDYDTFLMYSRVVRIDSINIYDKSNLNSPFPFIQSKELMKNAIGITFDYKHSTLFYSDIQRGAINSVYFNGSNHKIIIEKQGSIEGLAYEIMDKTIYYTCNTDATINKLNLEAEKPKPEVIIKLGPNDKPRGIAVDSCDSRMYWTNWNSHHPCIQRAFFSGFEQEAIITTDIRMPNALTLDHLSQKLFWGDARLDKIERCEYDGTGRTVLTKTTPQHAFDLAVYGNFLFWTDWVHHAVIRVNKYTGDDIVWLRKDVPRPMGIIAIADDTNDCFSNPCRVLNGGCEDICRLSVTGTVQCGCNAGRSLLGDKRRCATSSSPNCTQDEFQCSDAGCIPYHLTCDGIPHCIDLSDESEKYCATRTCQHGYFRCQNNRCLSTGRLCDEVNDCGDESDEMNCSCSPDIHFQCKAGPCILKKLRCDADPDCLDASDEMDCPKRNCTLAMSNLKVENCVNTTACILPQWKCDGQNDCWDNSDEQNCPKTTTTEEPHCSIDKFRCDSGQCISMAWRCDGQADCNDGEPSSDERDCGHPCREHLFQCSSDNECIPFTWECDGTPDCTDASDEHQNCTKRSCSSDHFLCNTTGRCIPFQWVCDSEADCEDRSDESPIQDCSKIAPVCIEENFMCLNNKCIPKEYYCDGDNDCGDQSDEPSTCKQLKCTDADFTCLNAKCVKAIKVCNGVDDCGDNSDEAHDNCKNVTCTGDDLFKCSNGVCVNISMLCDGDNNCGDFSDEDKCNINECEGAHKCAHICKDLKVGYECLCNEGYKKQLQNPNLCHDLDECTDLSVTKPCSQICRNTFGSYTCSCAEGYVLKDGHSCKTDSNIVPKLIFSNKYYIREMDLQGYSTLVANNLTNAVAVDFDWQTQCIYWSDVTALSSSIKRFCPNNNSYETLHSSTLHNLDGLAVDWVGRNLYWCDKGLDTIEVSTLDGKYRRVVVRQILQEPRAIALDPQKGYMYWTDWGHRPHIGKAGMDGSDVHIIVNKFLGWPNALTISYETNEIFWGDAREDYIAVADLEGNNMRILMSRSQQAGFNLHHIFAITVFEDYVYWTDWETKTVERCHKYSGKDCKTLTATIHRPMDIRVYHPYRQKPMANNPCKDNGGCSTLCLLAPEGRHTCVCPENFALSKDGKTCQANCSSSQFLCSTTYKCIPFWWKCDTQDDCGDRSDEPSDCPAFDCLPGQFQCKNKQCIHPSNLCNGESDCADKSDEVNCDEYTCMDTQFKCKGNGTVNGYCIMGNKHCDDIPDCPLGEDEKDCPEKTCPPNQFRCDNSKNCIPLVWVCDGDNDCKDNSDEGAICKNRTCSERQILCKSGRCIPETWQCDGTSDCPDGEDEPKACSDPTIHTCNPTYFKCKNNKCIPGRWQCDYDDDCGDNSDEEHCKPRKCSESEFQCKDGRCIRDTLRCDGQYSCADFSDELDCNTTCSAKEFQCHNPKHCIYIDWHCDGDVDCSDGSDELDCGKGHCNSDTEFTCANQQQCISLLWRCDGEVDCSDKSDEEDSLCSTLTCPPLRFRCKNHKCISRLNLCDGFDGCGDGSDEDPRLCQRQGMCKPNETRCTSGHCISASARCDGFNDCEDNSDEFGCTPPCIFGVCSQICVESKKGSAKCSCAEGYSLDLQNNTCTAEGPPPSIILASDSDIRIMMPYKTQSQISSLTASPNHKIDFLDVFWDPQSTLVFWTDRHSKKIIFIKLSVTGAQLNQGYIHSQDIISNLADPKGIAVDWVAHNIYWVDSGSETLMVSTFTGQQMRTLLEGIKQPHDIVVDPKSGTVIWSEWGTPQAIKTCGMDGSNPKDFVSEVFWPTGLAIDYPARRLYWADAKSHTIESIKLNGLDREVVHKFEHGPKPYQLDVFENSVFVTIQKTHDVLRINKLGLGNVEFVARGLNRVSDIVIIQKYKQENLTNPCNTTKQFRNPSASCHKSALCVISKGGNGFSCICPDGLVPEKANATGNEVICGVEKNCPLKCHSGECVLSDTGPYCKCPFMYRGTHCEHYICSQHCKNKGMCFPDLLSPRLESSPPPLKCNCQPQWTGERCEIPVFVCRGFCLNGGTCTVPRPGLGQCTCRPGFTGTRCENKDRAGFVCRNGGSYILNNPQLQCACPPGFHGTNCQDSVCDNYCTKGSCSLTANGPVCHCPPGIVGKKCDRDACKDHCLNGGQCVVTAAKKQSCVCPPLFSGRRCQIDLCNCQCSPGDGVCACLPTPPEKCSKTVHKCFPQSCLNGGICHIIRDQAVCECASGFGGQYCEKKINKLQLCQTTPFCLHGGVCTIIEINSEWTAKCVCPFNYTGKRCEAAENVTSHTCKAYCLNGATCNLNSDPDLMPSCVCRPGFYGVRCESIFKDEPQPLDRSVDMEGEGLAITGVFIILSLLLLLLISLGLVAYVLKTRRSGKAFSHVRMQDNVEISNPMYQSQDLEEEAEGLGRDFGIDSERACNFGNPVYESMYNPSNGSVSEEKKGLLQSEAMLAKPHPLASSRENL